MRMKLANGEVYDVPDADVRRAQSEYGAVPADSVTVPDQPTGGNVMGDVGGMGAGALEAIGGPRTLLYGGGGLGALAVGKKLLGRTAAPPVATATKPKAGSPRRAGAKLPSSLVEVTKADIKNHSELRNYKPGDTIRRVRMEQIKMTPAPGVPRGTLRTPPQGVEKDVLDRVNEAKARGETVTPRDVTRFAKEASGGPPTRPIEIVEGGQRTPARAPAQTKEPPYTGGRGASGPELERRGSAMSRASMRAAPPPDLEAQLARSLEAEAAISELGVARRQARIPLRSGLRVAGGGLAALLPFILGIQGTAEQMDEARRIYIESIYHGRYF